MQLQGSLVAIVTPFRDGKIDVSSYRKLIEFQIEHGTSGIIPCGTTGESATLTHAEHAELVALTCELVNKRVPVIAGTGSNATHEAIRLTQEAKKAGADASLLITPYYNKPTQQGLFEHFTAVADAVDLPVVLYNVPGRTACSLAPTTVFRLAEHPRIVAVKDATGSLDWTSEVVGGCNLTILSGDDSATLASIALGAQGVISVLANVAPRAMAELVAKALAGEFVEARQIHRRYFHLMKSLFIESNPIPVKAALHMMGMIGPDLRLPLTPISEGTRTQLREALQRVGLV
jgi:4-hydroxy-tetrahydrodipicolinate synthase